MRTGVGVHRLHLLVASLLFCPSLFRLPCRQSRRSRECILVNTALGVLAALGRAHSCLASLTCFRAFPSVRARSEMLRALPVKSFTLKGPDPPSTFRSPSPNCRHAHATALRHQDARLTPPAEEIPLPNVSLAPPTPLLPLQLSIPISYTRHWGLVHPRPRRASAFAHFKRREIIFKGSTPDSAPCIS